MVGINKIIVIGNLGTDPEMRYTPNGNPVTSFRIATTRNYNTQDGERRQDTEWFTVVAWNQLAEQCNQYLTKGRRTYVEGRLHSHQWEGNDGQTRFRNEIIADRVLFLDRAGAGEPTGESAPAEADQANQASQADVDQEGGPAPDDLPF